MYGIARAREFNSKVLCHVARQVYVHIMILGNCEGTVSLVPGRRARVFV